MIQFQVFANLIEPGWGLTLNYGYDIRFGVW